mmetsp:Transcript_26261/g.77046  ORF Transcript_26261/g.77046 Transcript_26261/m.77046 type:complete len:366 (-) Transcript_26261:875-1972(-)
MHLNPVDGIVDRIVAVIESVVENRLRLEFAEKEGHLRVERGHFYVLHVLRKILGIHSDESSVQTGAESKARVIRICDDVEGVDEKVHALAQDPQELRFSVGNGEDVGRERRVSGVNCHPLCIDISKGDRVTLQHLQGQARGTHDAQEEVHTAPEGLVTVNDEPTYHSCVILGPGEGGVVDGQHKRGFPLHDISRAIDLRAPARLASLVDGTRPPGELLHVPMERSQASRLLVVDEVHRDLLAVCDRLLKLRESRHVLHVQVEGMGCTTISPQLGDALAEDAPRLAHDRRIVSDEGTNAVFLDEALKNVRLVDAIHRVCVGENVVNEVRLRSSHKHVEDMLLLHARPPIAEQSEGKCRSNLLQHLA